MKIFCDNYEVTLSDYIDSNLALTLSFGEDKIFRNSDLLEDDTFFLGCYYDAKMPESIKFVFLTKDYKSLFRLISEFIDLKVKPGSGLPKDIACKAISNLLSSEELNSFESNLDKNSSEFNSSFDNPPSFDELFVNDSPSVDYILINHDKVCDDDGENNHDREEENDDEDNDDEEDEDEDEDDDSNANRFDRRSSSRIAVLNSRTIETVGNHVAEEVSEKKTTTKRNYKRKSCPKKVQPKKKKEVSTAIAITKKETPISKKSDHCVNHSVNSYNYLHDLYIAEKVRNDSLQHDRFTDLNKQLEVVNESNRVISHQIAEERKTTELRRFQIEAGEKLIPLFTTAGKDLSDEKFSGLQQYLSKLQGI